MLERYKKSITVIIPAYNEEFNLSDTIDSINVAITGLELDIEIIIVNDGSQDKTGLIADTLALNNPNIQSVHHFKNKGLGNAYFTGVKAACKNYIVMIPGDNENGPEALTPLLSSLGESDIIIPYPANNEIRSAFRRAISKIFISLVNFMSGLKLRYYNGTVVHRRDLLQGCPIRSNGFAYQAKILIYLIQNGRSYQHVPIKLNYNKTRASTAFKLHNLISVGRALIQIAIYRFFRNEKWFST